MARIEGKDITKVSIVDAGTTERDFTTETLSIEEKYSKEQHDTTTLSKSWKEFTDGLKGGDDLSWELYYNNAANSVWATITGLFAVATPTNLVITDGTKTATIPVSVKSFSKSNKVNDMVKMTVSLQMNGAVVWS